MKSIETQKQFYDTIKNENVVAVFSADWCPDCRVIEPVLPEIEQAYPNFTFVEVDRDQLINICQEYDVFGIPSFIAFKNGEEAGRFVSKDRKTKDEVMAFMDKVSS
ncbi:thioredoxin family protein [Lentibacillus amyloliquefaciens]|uniref:Thioredoxin n=1 Tax=Lentibacillus amyloliquefaciens TaxID=1472767 RepID=A0A0U4FKZ1_9BACI|nr:thioredoxin family protein [Lentibacillus amyloliquefaciens]ALX48388.1 thioredoxin [Lentibacillus amyloliquefaciens]